MRTLKDLRRGEKGKVKRIKIRGSVHRRLRDMGINPGITVEMIKPAPLGDPLEFKLKGYHLSIRKSIAEKVMIEND